MAKKAQKKSLKSLSSKLWAELKKRWVVLLICLGVMIGSYWTLFHHYRTFIIGTNESNLVYRVESKLLDIRLRLRGPKKPKSKIGILAIDEKSLHEFGRWPFSRRYYAQAFDNLKKLGVKWVGFDSIYSEAEKTFLEDATPVLKTMNRGGASAKNWQQLQEMLQNSPSDHLFADSLTRFGNIVLGYFYFGNKQEAVDGLNGRDPFIGLDAMSESQLAFDMPQGRQLSDYHIKKAYGIVSNTPLIASSSKTFGFFSNDADDDAINRWGVLVADVGGTLMPSLALKTVAEYLDRDAFVFFDSVGIESIALINRQDQSDVIEIPVDPLGGGRILINHLGPAYSFPHFSLADAYNNSFTEKQKAALKGSMLLMGATATGINDLRPNPFDPAIDGVENHAAMIDNIASKDFLRRPTSIFAIELMIVLGIGLLYAPIMLWSSALFSGLSVFAFLIGYYYVDKYLWFSRGIWAYMAVPYSEIIAMYVGTTLYKYVTEEAEKKMVKGVFQHYLSPEVIEQVLDNPDALRLGGEKKELTVFFSDVRSFTTISESLTPEKLCELMNEYFTPMTSIILRGNGVLDKYIGDAIMAFWGAPVNLPNHADAAAASCVEMLFALDKIREDFPKKGFPVIDIGIGLNTGLMSVGNMGSGERFCYTVMGDSVNLGSRLEGLTKEYGIKVMISEFTKNKLTPGKFLVRDLDDIRVKGKNEPVNVFEIMRPDFLRETHLIKEFIEAFETGRKFYKVQDWQNSQKAFFQCLQIKPDDKATGLYMERIQEYMTESPGETWDGVYTFKHK